jgi:hypothetical protein
MEHQLLNPGAGEGDYTLYPNKPWTVRHEPESYYSEDDFVLQLAPFP